MRLQGSQIAPSLAVLERLGIAVFKRRVALRADVIADIILGGGALSHKQSLVSMCPAARTGNPCPPRRHQPARGRSAFARSDTDPPLEFSVSSVNHAVGIH